MASPNKHTPAATEPTDYGLPPGKLYEALRLEHRTNSGAETAGSITGLSVEALQEHYWHLIVRLASRIPTMTRKNALDISTGRAQRREKIDAA